MAWIWGSALLADGGLANAPQPQFHQQANGQSRNSFQWARKKKVLLPQAGLCNWAVLVSLPPSMLPSSPSSTVLTPNPDLEAPFSPAAGAAGTEHLALLSGDLNLCQGRKGIRWVSGAVMWTLSSGSYTRLPGGLPFLWAPGGLLGDRILPNLRWSVATVAPAVLLAALALWLPCVALHLASCCGEAWGPPELCMWSPGLPCSAQFCASPGTLGRSCWGVGGSSTVPSRQYTCRACADTGGASHGITHLGDWLMLKRSL